ncbi:galactokinase [Myxococcota bacterium]|nr:galactokinase [Myxococcota bacterium]
MSLRDHVITRFVEHHGESPSALVRAPGRVNLIGEHTDYNEGFVLPMAIDRECWIALRPRNDTRVRIHSLLHDESMEFDVTAPEPGSGWAEYPKGVAWAMTEDGHALNGWEGIVGSSVPLGAGLSSSASFTLASARALAGVSDISWDPVAMAKLCQRAENHWLGVHCGVMDPLICSVGREGQAVLIDCRNLDQRPVPLPPDTGIVILDTGTRRGLVGSAYNERRNQCEQAARALGVESLRDISDEDLEKGSIHLEAVPLRRARHVVGENTRTLEAARAMQAGDAERLGSCMNASHQSLRDDFEVSSHELDVMVECARGLSGCLGARMTGAGFGGCALALVEAAAIPAFCEEVAQRYTQASNFQPQVHVCRARAGVEWFPDAVSSR